MVRQGERSLPAACYVWCASGALVYGALALWALGVKDSPFFGYNLYETLWLRLAEEGRLDVPIRVIGAEGHYRPDGTAFAYNGMAPMVTRALAWPFVDLRTLSLGLPTVVAFGWLGSVFYLRAFAERLAALDAPPARRRTMLHLVAAMVFLIAPGPLLMANTALYTEGIAVAWAMGGIAFWALARVAAGARGALWAVPIVGAVAAVTVHARPHVAIVLYATTLALMALALWRARRAGGGRMPPWQTLRPVVLTLALMGLAGGLILAANTIRAGSPLVLSGAPSPGALQYGSVFWQFEGQTEIRALTWTEMGTFNLRRVPANAVIYAADHTVASSLLSRGVWTAQTWLRGATGAGWVRVELPLYGAALIWTPWLVLAVVGAWRWLRGQAGMADRAAAGVLALFCLGAAVFMLSYMTVTARYMAELWPALALGALGALPWLAATSVPSLTRGLGLTMAVAAVFMIQEVRLLPYKHRASDGLADWTVAGCELVAARKGLAADWRARACAEPPWMAGSVTAETLASALADARARADAN